MEDCGGGWGAVRVGIGGLGVDEGVATEASVGGAWGIEARGFVGGGGFASGGWRSVGAALHGEFVGGWLWWGGVRGGEGGGGLFSGDYSLFVWGGVRWFNR
jgi:hypothetical protein